MLSDDLNDILSESFAPVDWIDDGENWGEPYYSSNDSWGQLGRSLALILQRKEVQDLLIKFGEGLLQRKRSRKQASPEEELAYKIGDLIGDYILEMREDRALLREQKRRMQEMHLVREIKKLKALSPGDFEYWTGAYFESHGFKKVLVTSYSADGGVDVHMTCPDGKKAVVQCKRYSKAVGRPTVQQTYGIMHLLDAQRCYVVTTAWFSRYAKELNRRRDIALLDGKFLVSSKKPPGSRR